VAWLLPVLVCLAGMPIAAPYRDLTAHGVEYAGPGRDDPEPVGLDEVRIGYFGPSDPADPLGGDMWLAASLAVDEANRAGGYGGLPFRLLPAWSENPWGTGVGQVARMAWGERAWAIIGSVDGAATHLAEQVVAKARLALVSPVSTDETVNLANVAWMFSCLPLDGALAEVMGRALIDDVGDGPFLLISGTDHDSRSAVLELTGVLNRKGVVPRRHLELDTGTNDIAGLVDTVMESDARAVVIVAGPIESARLVVALRERRDDLRILGGPSMQRRAFLERAGPAAEGVRCPLLCDPQASASEFARAFSDRFGRQPDCAAIQTYDATRLVIEEIQEAGLNRARIRDAIQAAAPWSGAAGSIDWDPIGRNRREPRLAEVSGGRVVPLKPDQSVEP